MLTKLIELGIVYVAIPLIRKYAAQQVANKTTPADKIKTQLQTAIDQLKATIAAKA